MLGMDEYRKWHEVRAELIRTPEDEARVAAARVELEAQLLEGIAEAERGETVNLGDFSQHLDEADYQLLADSHDAEDAAYRQAMRARKRGRPEA